MRIRDISLLVVKFKGQWHNYDEETCEYWIGFYKEKKLEGLVGYKGHGVMKGYTWIHNVWILLTH